MDKHIKIISHTNIVLQRDRAAGGTRRTQRCPRGGGGEGHVQTWSQTNTKTPQAKWRLLGRISSLQRSSHKAGGGQETGELMGVQEGGARPEPGRERGKRCPVSSTRGPLLSLLSWHWQWPSLCAWSQLWFGKGSQFWYVQIWQLFCF